MILEMHTHTNHSRGKKIYYDGISSPEEMVKGAKRVGADGIFITDHNEIKGAFEAQKFARKHGVKVFVGEEISTVSGHVLALGIQEWIRPGMTVDETLDAIHRQGGMAVGAHPFDIKRDGVGHECLKCDATEVFNPVNLDRHSNKKALRVARENGRAMTVGSDAHWSMMLGYGQMETEAESLEGILKAIKSGKASIKTARYVPLRVIGSMAVEKLRKSYEPTLKYIENYSWPKRPLSRYMLSLVRRNTIGLERFYGLLTIVAFGSVIIYGKFRSIVD
jgi:predicted metal-dependent phosphoesterase TrpH